MIILLGSPRAIHKKGSFVINMSRHLLSTCTHILAHMHVLARGQRGKNVYINSLRKSFIEIWSFMVTQLRSDVRSIKSCLLVRFDGVPSSNSCKAETLLEEMGESCWSQLR